MKYTSFIERLMAFFRHMVAFFSGTFVADCPKCHQYFYGFHKYGHQVSYHTKYKHDEIKHYRYVCHRCVLEHGRHHG